MVVMPERFNQFKSVAWLSIFALPPVALAITAWLLSVYTDLLQSPGQILLVYTAIFGLVALSGYLFQSYIKQKYLKPLETITFLFKSVLNKNFKPLQIPSSLGEFEPVYTMLNKLQQSFVQDTSNFSALNQAVLATSKLFEAAILETTDPIVVLSKTLEVKHINQSAENLFGVKKIDTAGRRIYQFVRF